MGSLEKVNSKMQELKSQFLDMAQLKSNFDIEKFTVRKEGNFIAHCFHFLMRQYHLALYEARRMYLDRKEKIRDLEELENTEGEKVGDKYVDIEIDRLKNELDLVEINLKSKVSMIEHFEKCRLRLIEENGGNPPTNEQYQNEEPKYWEWFIKKKAYNQFRARTSGIEEGTWDAIEMMEAGPVINPAYQLKIGSRFNIEEIEKELTEMKSLPDPGGIINKGKAKNV